MSVWVSPTTSSPGSLRKFGNLYLTKKTNNFVMSKLNTRAIIDANIRQNGQQLITGQVLNSVLNSMVTDYAEQAALDAFKEKVDALALGAFYGYFPDSSSLPVDMTTPGYAYVGLDNPYKIWNFNGKSWSDSGTSIDMNDADEEDITRNADGKLQFKDRVYGDGMGYVILRKDKTFAEQVTQANTIYEIRYDFDLSNSEITIPTGSSLIFNGGKLYGGTINFNNCSIIGDIGMILFDGITIGSLPSNKFVYSKWFNFTEQNPDADILTYLLSVGLSIIVNNGNYTLTKTITKTTLDECFISGYPGNKAKVQITFKGCDGFQVEYLEIKYLTLRGNAGYKGIIIAGSKINVDNNDISLFDFGIYRNDTGTSIVCDIKNNTIQYCHNTGIYIKGSPSGYTAIYNIFENYIVKCGDDVDDYTTNGTTGLGYGIYICGSQEIIVRYNVIEYCSCCGIFLTSTGTDPIRFVNVQFNTFEQNKRAQIILCPKNSGNFGDLVVDNAYSSYPVAKVSNFLKEFYYGSDDSASVTNIFRSGSPASYGYNKFFMLDSLHPIGYNASIASTYIDTIPSCTGVIDPSGFYKMGKNGNLASLFICFLRAGETAYIEIDVAIITGTLTSVYMPIKQGSQTYSIVRAYDSSVRRNIVRITAKEDGYVYIDGSYISGGASNDLVYSVKTIVRDAPPYLALTASERDNISPINFIGLTAFDLDNSKMICHNGTAWTYMDGMALG